MTDQTMRFDALKEIINIGGGHVATSLSQLTKQRVDMHVPEVAVYSYDELYEQSFSEDNSLYTLTCPIVGELEGIFLFVLTDEAVEKMTHWLLDDFDQISESLRYSAMSELMNIVTNSFLNAIAHLLSIEVKSQFPKVMYDYFGSIIGSIYVAYEQYDDQVLFMKNEFQYEGQSLDTSLFFIPKTGELEKLFQAIGL